MQALKFRNKMMTAVYRKTLRLSAGALAEENAGRIVTLMSNDAQKIQARARARIVLAITQDIVREIMICLLLALPQEFFPSVHELWAAPALIGVALWLLYGVLAWTTFIGLAAIMVCVPLTGAVAGKLFGLRARVVALADKRVNLMSEARAPRHDAVAILPARVAMMRLTVLMRPAPCACCAAAVRHAPCCCAVAPVCAVP